MIEWTNEKRKLSDLIPWERNPRQLTEKQAKQLEKSLAKFGQAYPLLISPDNEIYDGHQRESLMRLMKEYGADAVIDVRVSSRKLTLKERKELVVRLHENVGEWDLDGIANLYDLDELEEWGFSSDILNKLDFAGDELVDDPGAQIDKAEELREKWGVENGQLWQLGEHRVICGDCTDETVVDKLMGGEKADMVFTDPPYGVDYTGGTTKRDRLDGDKTPALYFPALQRVAENTIDKVAVYLWHSDSRSSAVLSAVLSAGLELRSTIIWNKNMAQFGALGSQYKTKHEPLYYLYKRNMSPNWYGPTNEVTVWDCDRESTNKLHPTQKPVKLAERAMNNSSEQDDIILDIFLGSGTTLIACERLSRKCRGVEIEPKYVAVTLERWHQMTDKTPVLLEG